MIRINQNLCLFSSCKTSQEITSWWIDSGSQPFLIDCPEINEPLIKELSALASGRSPTILLTSRESHNNFKKLRKFLNWDVLVQEQEAYLLPETTGMDTFSDEFISDSGLKVLWTPGPTPGSCIAYAPPPLNVLFCGRLLIPVSSNEIAALRTKKTFHWSIQQKSLKKLRDWIPPNSFPLLASGASLVELGGEKLLPWEAWKFTYE